MDNQHPSPEQGKVQRSSRKRVLDNIVWETPRTINKVYIYVLCSTRDMKTRYVGSTINPHQRYLQHTTKKVREGCVTRNTNKERWVIEEFNNGFDIIMRVLESFDDIESALVKEEFLITNALNLVNTHATPTRPGSTPYYVHDLYTNTTELFPSMKEACEAKGLSYVYSDVTDKQYIFSKEADYNIALFEVSTLKAKKEERVIYAVNQTHLARLIGCSKSAVNMSVMKIRGCVKGWDIARIDEEFNARKNTHRRKVICVNDGLVFDDAVIAGKYYNTDPSCIGKVCKGFRKHTNNLVFKYCDDMIQP